MKFFFYLLLFLVYPTIIFTDEKKLPFNQLVKTCEISPLICYLISKSSGIITGAIIDYDQNIIGSVPE